MFKKNLAILLKNIYLILKKCEKICSVFATVSILLIESTDILTKTLLKIYKFKKEPNLVDT